MIGSCGPVELMQPLADMKDQAIEVITAGEVLGREVLVAVDRDVVSRALMNLLTNAVKYSPFGSTTRVELGFDGEGGAVVSVRDEGVGLTEDDLARLFQQHQRLSAVPTGGESSSGIGLHASAKLIESVGGTIDAESAGARPGFVFPGRVSVGVGRGRLRARMSAVGWWRGILAGQRGWRAVSANPVAVCRPPTRGKRPQAGNRIAWPRPNRARCAPASRSPWPEPQKLG